LVRSLTNDAMQSNCRFCNTKLHHTLVDLGMSPLCESYLTYEKANQMERFFPLRVYVCHKCFLVQLEQYVSRAELFSEYAYFSSYSDSWLDHAERYTDMIVGRFGLGPQSAVIELGSNDGYLLQYFLQRSIKAIGVEPATNVAAAAEKKGVHTITKFFGRKVARQLARQYGNMDLMIGNNVLAQVPDLSDFVTGMKVMLKPDGVITMEFPHLMRLMNENQFDTIYHEHFSYFSFMTVEKVFTRHGLALFDVEELASHGGSLRIYAQHSEFKKRPTENRITEIRTRELQAGFDRIETYGHFGEQVKETKRQLLEFMISAKRNGNLIVGYGAPGKGNTLLNYCGIRDDFIDYTVDRNTYKQGKLLPGTHIPILHPDKIRETKPDYLLILPWNLKDEIMAQMSYIREWGGRFVVPIPRVTVYS
jgi:hypothetical protein